VRIVNRETFLALQAGVMFSKYSPLVFGELMIKGDTAQPNDFWYQDIADAVAGHSSNERMDTLFDSEKSGASFAMDFECESRDALFDADELFAVWEQADIDAFKKRLESVVGA